MLGRTRGAPIGCPACVVAAVLASLVPAQDPAQDPAKDADQFERELRRVQVKISNGRVAEAKKVFDAALEGNQGADFVRAHRESLVGMARRLAFLAQHPPPSPKDIVSGELQRYEPRTGRIKITYAPNQLEDFGVAAAGPSKGPFGELAKLGGFRTSIFSAPMIHPMVFRGPYTVTVRGSKYPDKGGGYVAFFLDVGPEGGYDVCFGAEKSQLLSQVRWIPATIRRLSGGESKELATRKNPPVKAGEKFVAAVRVDKGSIRATFNKRLVLKAKKRTKDFGQAGFVVRGNGSVDSITFEGLANTAWMQGKVDAVQSVELAAFEKRFRPRDHLPAWVFAASSQKADPTTVAQRASRGPSWPQSFVAKTRHYVVTSNLDKPTSERAARVLEESLRAYQSDLGWLDHDDSRRYSVYLFAGEAGYQRYCKKILGSAVPHTAGLYAPELGQLLIWNLPDREAMWRTVRHEALHQYLDQVVGDTPIWLNEGLAEYYEVGERSAGRFRGGPIHRLHVRVLLERGLVPLATFLALDVARFRADSQRHYAQSWAIVRFLLQGRTQHRQIFRSLFEQLENADPEEATERVFDAVDVDELDSELEAALQRWAKKLK